MLEKKQKILLSFIYKQDSNYAQVIVKKKFKKGKVTYKLVAKAKKEKAKLKFDRLPIELCHLREYLQKALKVEFDKKGGVKDVKLKSVDMSEIRKQAKEQLLIIHNEYEVRKEKNIQKEID